MTPLHVGRFFQSAALFGMLSTHHLGHVLQKESLGLQLILLERLLQRLQSRLLLNPHFDCHDSSSLVLDHLHNKGHLGGPLLFSHSGNRLCLQLRVPAEVAFGLVLM